MNATSCDLVCRLIDDYVDERLSLRDRQRVEAHVTLCSRCAQELHSRPAFDQHLRRELAAAVHPLRLAPEAAARISRAARRSVQRGVWSNRIIVAGQVLAGALSVLVLLAGLLYSLGRIAPPWSGQAVVLPPGTQVVPPMTGRDLVIEPAHLLPGRPFTTTLYVRNDRPEPLAVSRIALDIYGPGGRYHFVLAAVQSFPAQSVSVLRITPDYLRQAAETQYHISPSAILNKPGAYTIRLTLISPRAAPER